MIENISDSSISYVNITFDGPDTYEDQFQSPGSQIDEIKDIGGDFYGDYSITASAYDDSDSELNSDSVSSVTVDGNGPEVSPSSPSDGDAVSNDEPTIEFDVNDDHIDIESYSLDVVDGSGNNYGSISESGLDVGTSTSDEFDVNENLDDGTYTVEWQASDQAGNSESGEWSFTVDTSYDGPEDFSFDPSSGNIDVDEDDREIDVTLEDENNDDTDIDVDCLVDGDSEDDFTIDTGDGEDDTFTCDIPDDYEGEEFELQLELVDQAGNDHLSTAQSYGFDAFSPNVDSLDSVSGVATFNEDFDVEYTASDDVSDISTVEYYIGDDPGLGEGTQFTEASNNFTVDTSDLESGSHTLYLRAEDEFGKWSSTESFEFDFYPDEVPEASLSVVDSLNVTSGSAEDLEVEVENTGVILIPSGDVSVSGFGSSSSFDSIAPDESVTVDVELSPSDEDLGETTLNVNVDGVDASAQVDVLVKANGDVQSDLESDLDSYEQSYENLSSRVDELSSRLSEDRKERLNSDFSEFETAVENARQAEENGEYYKVDEVLDDLESKMQSTRETADKVEKEQDVADRNRLIMMVGGLLVLLIGGGIGFVAYSDEYEFDVPGFDDVVGGEEDSEDGFSPESDDSEGLVDKIKSKIEGLKGGEVEETGPEYEFK